VALERDFDYESPPDFSPKRINPVSRDVDEVENENW
jgi:hypothetical protein